MAPQSRDANCARALHESLPSELQGRRESRVLAAPAASRAKMNETHELHSPQVQTELSDFPRAAVYGLLRALPGDRALLPRSFADCSTTLAPASGRQDHTTSPSALLSLALHAKSAQRHHRVHRIQRPTFRDDGDTSLCNRTGTGRGRKGDLPDGTSGIFFARGLDKNSRKLPVGEISTRKVRKKQRNLRRVRPTIGDGNGNGNYAVRFCPIASNCAFCSLLSVA
jgi:hypothetical protein